MGAVRFSDVRKSYGDTEVVHGLSLDIADGEFMVLVGPSGSGKTTALRMLAGLESITAGQIAIGDRVVNAIAPRERDIAMVFQDYALYPQMTVFDNLAFGLKRRKAPKDEIARRVEQAAASLDLGPYLQRKPGQLSGGQAQRVALARAVGGGGGAARGAGRGVGARSAVLLGGGAALQPRREAAHADARRDQAPA